MKGMSDMSSRTLAADDYDFIRNRMKELQPVPTVEVDIYKDRPNEDEDQDFWKMMMKMVKAGESLRNGSHGPVPKWQELSEKVGCRRVDHLDNTFCGYNQTGDCATKKKCRFS